MKALLILLVPFFVYGSNKDFVIISPSYNNALYYEENLGSLIGQNYDRYRILYIDDASPDGTGSLVESYLKEKGIDYRVVVFESSSTETLEETTKRFKAIANERLPFFTLVINEKRVGALANIYRGVHSCKDSSVALLVDGDDSLYHENVLRDVNVAYTTEGEVWLTHGTLIEHPSGSTAWCKPIPKNIVEKNAFRQYRCPSHLKTFYAWLFKKIDLKDLIYNGDFFAATSDMVIMFPMIEMAGERHAFLNEVNYKYNMVNELNDNKVNQQLQNDFDFLVRNRVYYQKLRDDEIPEFMRKDR